MTEVEKLANIFKGFKTGKTKIIPATVKSVDEDKYTAVVEFEKIELSARLTAVNDNNNKNVTIPKVNSWVLIMSINGSDTDYAIVLNSEIEKIIADDKYLIEGDEIILADEETAEQAILGEKAKTLFNDIITHQQSMNTLLLTFGSSQVVAIGAVPILAPLLPAYTALVTGLTAETAKITAMITQLELLLSNKVKIA